jgi:hypothetical protein
LLNLGEQKLQETNTNLPTINIYQRTLDRMYKCDDGSILIIEFDSSGKKERIIDYIVYMVLAFHKFYHEDPDKNLHSIKLVILYSGNVKRESVFDITKYNNNFFSQDNGLFILKQLFITDFIDSDAILEEAVNFIKLNQKLWMNKELFTKLCLASYGKPKSDIKDFCEKIMALAASPSISEETIPYSLLVASVDHIMRGTAVYKEFLRRRENTLRDEIAKVINGSDFVRQDNKISELEGLLADSEKGKAELMVLLAGLEKRTAGLEKRTARLEKQKTGLENENSLLKERLTRFENSSPEADPGGK